MGPGELGSRQAVHGLFFKRLPFCRWPERISDSAMRCGPGRWRQGMESRERGRRRAAFGGEERPSGARTAKISPRTCSRGLKAVRPGIAGPMRSKRPCHSAPGGPCPLLDPPPGGSAAATGSPGSAQSHFWNRPRASRPPPSPATCATVATTPRMGRRWWSVDQIEYWESINSIAWLVLLSLACRNAEDWPFKAVAFARKAQADTGCNRKAGPDWPGLEPELTSLPALRGYLANGDPWRLNISTDFFYLLLNGEKRRI